MARRDDAAARRRAPSTASARYRAANYDELIDHPVEMGDFALARFNAGGVPHDIAITGRQRADLDRLARDLARVCQWQIDLFGGARAAPFDRYLFQVTAVGDGYGGLEHRVEHEPPVPPRRAAAAGRRRRSTTTYLNFLGLASHEYFHAWNVKRIKPAAFAPYDLARENYTRQLWAFEGITSYYDDLALVALRRHRRRSATCELLGAHDHDGAAHAGAPRAERRRVELRRVDQVLPAGREHAERGRQLLHEGRARRAARSTCTLRRAGRARSTT